MLGSCQSSYGEGANGESNSLRRLFSGVVDVEERLFEEIREVLCGIRFRGEVRTAEKLLETCKWWHSYAPFQKKHKNSPRRLGLWQSVAVESTDTFLFRVFLTLVSVVSFAFVSTLRSRSLRRFSIVSAIAKERKYLNNLTFLKVYKLLNHLGTTVLFFGDDGFLDLRVTSSAMKNGSEEVVVSIEATSTEETESFTSTFAVFTVEIASMTSFPTVLSSRSRASSLSTNSTHDTFLMSSENSNFKEAKDESYKPILSEIVIT